MCIMLRNLGSSPWSCENPKYRTSTRKEEYVTLKECFKVSCNIYSGKLCDTIITNFIGITWQYLQTIQLEGYIQVVFFFWPNVGNIDLHKNIDLHINFLNKNKCVPIYVQISTWTEILLLLITKK